MDATLRLPGGHPSKYYSNPKAFSLKIMMGFGVVDLPSGMILAWILSFGFVGGGAPQNPREIQFLKKLAIM